MRFDVITLFPELFAPFLASGVTRRAYESKQVDVHLWNPRDFAEGNYRRVDDRPFGGGPGMVMMAEPLAQCLAAIKAQRGDTAPVVLFSPIGAKLDHAGVERWSASQGARARLRTLRRGRPALHRPPRRCADQPGRLRAFRRRDSGHGPAGRGCPPAAGRAGRRGQPPVRQLQPRPGRAAGLPALHPSGGVGGTARPRPSCSPATMCRSSAGAATGAWRSRPGSART